MKVQQITNDVTPSLTPLILWTKLYRTNESISGIFCEKENIPNHIHITNGTNDKFLCTIDSVIRCQTGIKDGEVDISNQHLVLHQKK